jgi:hypothetical protein
VEKKFMGFGNDAKKIYSGLGKDRDGDCYRRFMDNDGAEEICPGTAG